MNLLYLTNWDAAGQQFNGYLLHRALLERGHRSHMVVGRSVLREQGIQRVPATAIGRALNKASSWLGTELSMHRIFPTASLSLPSMAPYRSASIVHLQIVHGGHFFSLLQIPAISRRKHVVWTMHDPWMTSGHCVHSMGCERWQTGCGRCPDLSLPLAIKHDTTRLMWKIKRSIMRRSRVTLVVASEWMSEVVARSPILSGLPCRQIPFGVDGSIFRPLDTAKCRARFGIPRDSTVIAFRSIPFRSDFKGMGLIERALQLFDAPPRTVLLTLDQKGGLDSLRDKYRFVELGWVEDRQKVVEMLGAADVFLMPSTAEAFGMMAVEAMACGTCVVVSEKTSLPGVVRAPKAGLSIPQGDHEALAGALEMLLSDRARRLEMGRQGVDLVRREYSEELYVKRHLELYQDLLGGPRGGVA